jgi:hypothetical protein
MVLALALYGLLPSVSARTASMIHNMDSHQKGDASAFPGALHSMMRGCKKRSGHARELRL